MARSESTGATVESNAAVVVSAAAVVSKAATCARLVAIAPSRAAKRKLTTINFGNGTRSNHGDAETNLTRAEMDGGNVWESNPPRTASPDIGI